MASPIETPSGPAPDPFLNDRQRAAAAPDQKADNIFEAIFQQVANFVGKWGSMIAKVDVSKLGSVGVAPSIDKIAPFKADAMANPYAAGFSPRGGVLANFSSELFGSARDFSKLQAPSLAGAGVEPGSAMDMSFASLGQLIPSAGGGGNIDMSMTV